MFIDSAICVDRVTQIQKGGPYWCRSKLPRAFSLLLLVFGLLSLDASAESRYIAEGGASFHQFPDASSGVKGKLGAGSKVDVLSATGDWLMVSNADQSKVGWVLKSQTSLTTPKREVAKAVTKPSQSTTDPTPNAADRKASTDTSDDDDGFDFRFWFGLALVLVGYFICKEPTAGWVIIRVPVGLLLIFGGISTCVG